MEAKNNLKFVYFKKLNKGQIDEKELMSFFQAECLREYFIMEIEARKLKKS